jgi:hypothetical protein
VLRLRALARLTEERFRDLVRGVCEQSARMR